MRRWIGVAAAHWVGLADEGAQKRSGGGNPLGDEDTELSRRRNVEPRPPPIFSRPVGALSNALGGRRGSEHADAPSPHGRETPVLPSAEHERGAATATGTRCQMEHGSVYFSLRRAELSLSLCLVKPWDPEHARYCGKGCQTYGGPTAETAGAVHFIELFIYLSQISPGSYNTRRLIPASFRKTGGGLLGRTSRISVNWVRGKRGQSAAAGCDYQALLCTFTQA
ncbi:hypothetical protein C8R47DRAFT_1202394 [Mycena vitilis]|nr:hypothetical protein C8R47DRAFT_1202394 [Mycena vitilis]